MTREELEQLAALLTKERSDALTEVFRSDMPEEEVEAWIDAQPDAEAMRASLALEVMAFESISGDRTGAGGSDSRSPSAS
ncbi:MAG: hypothetical protein AAFX78_01950 [Cyanobacteria bacterium J06638_20]